MARTATTATPPPAADARVCAGCGLVIGSVVNRGGPDDRTVRHDIVVGYFGPHEPGYFLPPAVPNCRRFQLSTRPGYADMVEEVCVA